MSTISKQQKKVGPYGALHWHKLQDKYMRTNYRKNPILFINVLHLQF